ncbi:MULTISPECIES: DUF1176 domain-containing protein [unclassified Caulobacter]|uniref:DUF1176 domain-containing protein n=1 Tax=unclassified Caulobacter TaxID=2648921 RepID=UPI0006F5EC98|nr:MULTISPECIES: DUF1176 domain-containing protein [unclassified Caulobacter]KQV55134.1 hypothetical protein ASC62_21085 [Caulobacter sp. Root342]KQV63678.1 hypothetical protein ASC70_21560 [Caulobacter sp. Root343]
MIRLVVPTPAPWAVLCAVLLLAGPAAARDKLEIKDWWGACDNVRACTAYGFSSDDVDGVALRVRRDAGRNAPPLFDLVLGPEQGRGVAGALDLFIDGKAVARTDAPEGGNEDFRTWAVADGAALSAAIARGAGLELRAGKKAVATVSLSGASAVLRWIDDRQKRVGGVTALVAKGAAPAAAVPAPPPAPVIRAARAVSQKGLTDKLPALVRKRIAGLDCTSDNPALEAPESSRLGPGLVLWVIPCWVGAYQTASALVLADEAGGHARLADLGDGEGGGPRAADERAMATNANYDADQQKLYSYAKGRGVADCGITETRVWTGKAFVLADRSELSVCRGLPEEFWVETYRSR